MATISIACEQDRLPGFLVLHALAELWQARGLTVTDGRCFDPAADVCILHLNRTRIAPDEIPPAPPGAPVVNGRVLDISKRLFSVLAVDRQTDWDGPVIVKTNLNHFGRPERKSRPLSPQMANRMRMAKLSWRSARMLPDGTYPVLASVRLVPGWVWDNPDVIVEKFLPEREGDLYCLRGWMFFGTASYGWRLYATDPLVKTSSMVRHDYLTEVPDELLALKAATGFDFGKFDYVVHDGKPIVLDLNKTPGYSGDRASPRLRRLSEGIEEFLA